MAQRKMRSVSLRPEPTHQIQEEAARRLKLEAGRRALAEWERENGPLTPEELAEGRARARSSLGRPGAVTPS